MPDDEQAIRDLIATWMEATAAGDASRILPLMAEDVVFLQPGQTPMRGREGFGKAFEGMRDVRIEAVAETQEIKVSGNLAYCWNFLRVTVTPPEGGASPTRRSGHVLTVYRKERDGSWVLFRDANMLTVGEGDRSP